MNEHRLIPIADIIDTDRLRPVDEAWVAALAESIRDHGLEQPIVVRTVPDHYTQVVLVAGCHRLAAFRLLKQTEIPAIVREMSTDEARLVEIDENLMRRELDPLDRAVFLAERKAVYERMYPESAHGKAKKPKRNQGDGKVITMTTFDRFSKDAAKRTGLSEASVQRACRIYSELGSEAIAQLRGTPIAGNQSQLLLLARMSADERRRAIEAAVAVKAATVSAALRSVGAGRPAPNADEEQFRKLVDLWSRSGAKARRRFLAHIGLSEADVAGRDEQAA